LLISSTQRAPLRRGAAAALREVLRHHAAAAAVTKPPPRATSLPPLSAAAAARANAAWLEDMAVRLLCLLSLDRFGDYVVGHRTLCILLAPPPPRLIG
jgi:hypothetical protein